MRSINKTKQSKRKSIMQKFIIVGKSELFERFKDEIEKALGQNAELAKYNIEQALNDNDIDREDLMVLTLDDIADIMNESDDHCRLPFYIDSDCKLLQSLHGEEERDIYCVNCDLILCEDGRSPNSKDDSSDSMNKFLKERNKHIDRVNEFHAVPYDLFDEWFNYRKAIYEKELAESGVELDDDDYAQYEKLSFDDMVSAIQRHINGEMGVFSGFDNTAQSVK